MSYEIFTYGGGEILRDLFNGIAAAVGTSSYSTLLKLMGVFGLSWALLETAFHQRFSVNIRWFITFFLVMNLVLIPKTSVLVVDRVKGSTPYAIENVPMGLAFFASVASRIGDTLTSLTESVFTLPNDFKYHEAGTLMAGSIIRTASQFRITDAAFAADIKSYMQQCVQYDVLLGKYSLDELLTTNDIWTLVLKNPSPARAFMHQNTLKTCQEGGTLLNAAWEAEIERALPLYGLRFFESASSKEQAKNELLRYLPLSYQYMAALSDSAAALMQQNMLINAFEEGVLGQAATVGAGAAVQNYAQIRAMQQQRSAYQITGDMAAHWLPIMRNVFEAILYGSFLVLFPLMLLPVGMGILKGYLFSLFWLQTWAPLYAILNRVMTFFAQSKTMAASLTHKAHALSIATLPGIEQVNADMSVVAGYMAMSIPFLSYYLMNKGAAGFSQLATHLGSVTQSAVMHGAEEATSGNYSVGNVSLYNWNADNTSANHFNDNLSYQSGMASMQGHTGAMIHYTPDNTSVIETGHSVSTLPTSINFAESLRATYSQLSEKSSQAAVSHSEQLAKTQTGLYRDLYDYSKHVGHSVSHDNSMTHSQSTSTSETLNHYQSLVDTFAEQQGLSTSQAFNVLASASVSGSTGKWFKLPEISGQVGLQGVSDARQQEAFNAAHDFIQQQSFSEVTESAVRASQDTHYRTGNDTSERLSTSINSSFDVANSLRNELTTSLQQTTSYREAASLASDEASTINTVANQQFVNHLQQEMGITAAEHLLTRNPAAAHAKAAEFVEAHHSNILQQTALEKGLSEHTATSAKFKKEADILAQEGEKEVYANTLTGNADSQYKGPPIANPADHKISDTIRSHQEKTQRKLEDGQQEIKSGGHDRKAQVENESQKNTLKKAMGGALKSLLSWAKQEDTPKNEKK